MRRIIEQTLISKKNKSLIGKGAVSILDQGIFSGSNFLVTLLLGRWLLPEEYGIFSVSFSIYLFFSGIYSAFILEPLSVFGSGEKNNSDNYWVAAIYLHLIVCVLLAACIMIYSFFWGNGELIVIRSLAISFVFIETIFLLRWINYAKIKPLKSLTIDIVFGTILLFGILLLKKLDLVSPASYFYVYSFCSLLIGIIFFRQHQWRIGMNDLLVVLKQHFHYGKWIATASILQWFALQVYGILIAKNLSISDTASFRAVQNLSKPFEEVSTALTLLFIPWFSKQYSLNKSKHLLQRTYLISLLITMTGVIYLVILSSIGDKLILWVYQGKYLSYSYLIPLAICSTILLSLSKGAQIGVRVIQKPQLLLIGYAVSSVLTLVFSSPMIRRFGLTGAALGLIIASAGFSITVNLAFYFSNRTSNTKEINEVQLEI